MADTEKQGFRYPKEQWNEAVAKAAEMRESGWSIDMTKLLTAEVDLFRSETPAATARRLRLVKQREPVPVYRKPYAREAGE